MSRQFILIHGAWHGGWCWEHIQHRLEMLGHRVIAPDLPGHGVDLTPFPEITLQCYVDAVLVLLEGLDSEVVLVGHSLGGMVISQVAEHRPEQVGQLIYVAGFLPRDGDSFWDLSQLQKPTRHMARMQLNETRAEYVLPLKYMRDFAYHQTAPAVFEALQERFRPEPLLPLRESVHLTPEKFGVVPKHAIICSEDRALLALTQQQMIQRADQPVTSLVISSDHTPFYSHCDVLSQALCAPISPNR